MKQSKYNVVVEKNDYFYCFNQISGKFFKLKLDKLDKLRDILNNSAKYKDLLPLFYKQLLDGGFIVNNHTEELNIIRIKNNAAVNSKSRMLIILPTYNCNFRCWYCVQKHNTVNMTTEIIRRIKAHVLYICENENIENLQIDWFGGEPFLCFDDVVKPISSYGKQVCEANNINYISTATTNGFLITQSIASQIDQLNFTNFQITLDGDKEHHDKTRIAKAQSSFDKILSNINLICELSQKSKIIIRINYDNSCNLDKLFEELDVRIQNIYKDRIEFVMRRIWQVDSIQDGEMRLSYFINKLQSAGYIYRATSDLIFDGKPCYACVKGTVVISPTGLIDKCSARDNFELNPLGVLKEDGQIKWNNELPISEIFARPLFENPECLACKFLPTCMGPCPKEIDPKDVGNYVFSCKKGLNDLSFKSSILKICESQII